MKNKIVIALGTIIGLVVIVLALKHLKKGPSPEETVNKKIPHTLKERLEMDRDSLQTYLDNGTGSKHDLYGAMIRLTEHKDPLGEKVALQLADSEERLHREGAAQSLGNFSSKEAMEKLIELTQDKEPTVRQFALKGFGKIQSPERAKIIKELIESSSIPAADKVYLYTGYNLASEDASDKDWALNKLMTMANGRDEEVARVATLQILQIAPRTKKTIDMLYQKLQEDSDPRVMGIGIRILSEQRDPWLLPNLKKFSQNKNPLVRKAVIQSMHKHCSKDRWKILREIASKEENKSVIETMIREATLLSGDDAKAFFDMLADRELHKRAQDLITTGKERIAKAKGPCR